MNNLIVSIYLSNLKSSANSLFFFQVAIAVVFAGLLAVCTAYPSHGYHGDSDDYHYDYDGFGYGN